MPTYEYTCYGCGETFTKRNMKYKGPLPACPHCGSDDVKKKEVYETSFALKGGGWAKDGYGSKK